MLAVHCQYTTLYELGIVLLSCALVRASRTINTYWYYMYGSLDM